MEIMQLSLFRGVTQEDREDMICRGCLTRRSFEKGTCVFHTGDQIRQIGVVLSGSVRVESNDLWGNRSIFSIISQEQVFAESYALCRVPLMVDAVAAEDSEILLLHLDSLLLPENRTRQWYPRMLENLLNLCAGKNLTLSNRIFCTTPKTIRGRLVTYLSGQAAKNGSMDFYLPFDRQQLADYLNLDRSALSKELCRMRDQGMLRFHKNHFILLKLEEQTGGLPAISPAPGRDLPPL